jgi:metal-responsive CopG/Arc/MetJ family transcriptional regulator
MGRKRINDEQTPARVPAGTLKRIDDVLREGEKRADFIRTAIEREIKRRERALN